MCPRCPPMPTVQKGQQSAVSSQQPAPWGRPWKGESDALQADATVKSGPWRNKLSEKDMAGPGKSSSLAACLRPPPSPAVIAPTARSGHSAKDRGLSRRNCHCPFSPVESRPPSGQGARTQTSPRRDETSGLRTRTQSPSRPRLEHPKIPYIDSSGADCSVAVRVIDH